MKAIIIIEKEGIFRRLCEDNFTTNKLSSILGTSLIHSLTHSLLTHEQPDLLHIVTGCGFPDIATRALVSVLSRKYPLIPIYGT